MVSPLFGHGREHGARNYKRGVGLPRGAFNTDGERMPPWTAFESVRYGKGYIKGWLAAESEDKGTPMPDFDGSWFHAEE